MARRHGSTGDILMDPTGGATTVSVASLNKWSIDFDRDKEDVTCFGDTNKVYVLGLPDVQGDIEGVWDETTSPDFIRVALGDIPVTLKLIPSTLAPTYFFTGQAYLSTSIECAADGAVTLSGSFVAAGPWTMEPAGVMARARLTPEPETPTAGAAPAA
jgi:hypothetical protein